jgi:hypothetical protein
MTNATDTKAAAKAAADAKKAADKAAADAKKAADKAAADAKKAKDKADADAKKAKDAADKAAADKAAKEKAESKAAEKAAKDKAAADAKAAKEAAKMPEQNGIRRPAPAGDTGKVWAIADDITKKRGQAAAIAEVLEVGRAQTINDATIRTQYARWRKFNGVVGRVMSKEDIDKAAAAAAAAKAAADKKAADAAAKAAPKA